MPDSRLLLGVCGLYCGACYHRCASLPEGKHLLEEASCLGKDLQGFTCAGCRSNTLYIHPGCAECKIRTCADGKNILHCGLCSEFPCDRIKAFQNDGRVHHLDVISNLEELQAKDPDQWLAEQQKRWRCECGTSFSWYEILSLLWYSVDFIWLRSNSIGSFLRCCPTPAPPDAPPAVSRR